MFMYGSHHEIKKERETNLLAHTYTIVKVSTKLMFIIVLCVGESKAPPSSYSTVYVEARAQYSTAVS